MADNALVESLEKEAQEISKEMAGSTISFRRKRYLQGRLDQLNAMLARLAKSNNGNK